MNKNDLAFPFVETHDMQGESVNFGLTKRELFAAMAMQGMLSDEGSGCGGSWPIRECVERSVVFADALLSALAKDQTP